MTYTSNYSSIFDSIFGKKEKEEVLFKTSYKTPGPWRNTTTKVDITVTQDKAKKEIVEFHEYFVQVGYHLYEIYQERGKKVVEGFLFGIPVVDEKPGREYIIKDGKKLFIRTDFQGTKSLSS